MPKFQPNRAKPVSAALYNYLSDGAAKPLDEVYRNISAAVPMEKALRYRSRSKGEERDTANLVRKQREVVRIAILVAARDGRVVVDNEAKTIALTSETVEAWRSFVATTPAEDAPVQSVAPVQEQVAVAV
jgi:hypothetical protein